MEWLIKAGLAVGGILAVIVMIAATMFSTRWFSQQVTPINIVEVEDGVKCAQLITKDGAAIDCWHDLER